MDTEKLEALDPPHYRTVDVNGGVLGPPFLVVHNQLFCLADVEREVVVLVSDLLPVGRLIIVGDQAYHRCDIGKLK